MNSSFREKTLNQSGLKHRFESDKNRKISFNFYPPINQIDFGAQKHKKSLQSSCSKSNQIPIEISMKIDADVNC